MAGIKPGRAQRKPPYGQKVYVVRTVQGRTIASIWPRPRGRPPQPWQRAALDRMRISQRMVKTMPADEQAVMDAGLKDYLSKHRGVRGTAAIRLRDWLTMIVYGRAFEFTLPDGTRLRTAQQQRDASDWLDNAEPRLGSLLVRTDQAWLPTVQCQLGHVLTQSPSIPSTDCCPPASIPPKSEAMGGYD